jgi:protein-S-isoprenylcysteine O-methyltransferase Ste14
MRRLSIAAFVAMVAGIAMLFYATALFATHPVLIAVQAAALLMMIAARVTFGRRSFHAAADPTAGGLVTSGPYAFLRHPIYAAVIYFSWAGAVSHISAWSIAAALIITVGAAIRMVSEERLLSEKYPAYADYQRRVKRVLPFVF